MLATTAGAPRRAPPIAAALSGLPASLTILPLRGANGRAWDILRHGAQIGRVAQVDGWGYHAALCTAEGHRHLAYRRTLEDAARLVDFRAEGGR